MKKFVLTAILAAILTGCGGGDSDAPAGPVAVPQRLVGEVIAYVPQIASSELDTNAGYAGNLTASYALQAAGKAHMLDLGFVRDADAEAKLVAYAKEHGTLLTPGVRVLVADELYWHPNDPAADDVDVLQHRLEAFTTAAALVRKHIPQARVGVTITPYAMIGRTNSMEYAKRAIALSDWVGTDPYWFGGDNVKELNDWSHSFSAVAKQANPAVETWFIAQAFKMPEWDTATFNAFTKEQLAAAEGYDHILFFGWQFVSEIDTSAAGMHFGAETKALFSKYLKAQ
jgi:hypothetical protein